MKRSTKLLPTFLSLCFFLISIPLMGFFCQPTECQLLQKSLGKEMFQALCSAKEVSVFSVSANDLTKEKGVQEKKLSKEEVNSLKSALLCDANYFFDKKKRCPFVPELGIHFHKPTIVVLLNLDSMQAKFTSAEKSVILDYDPGKDQLNPLLKKLKPEVQSETMVNR